MRVTILCLAVRSLPLALALAIGGCASDLSSGAVPGASGVAVIGVGVAEGVGGAVNRAIATRDLVAVLEDSGHRVMPPVQVRERLGDKRQAALLERFSRERRLDPHELARIAAADLPARRGLFVRIESDSVEELPPELERVVDAAGDPIVDRARLVLATRRETTLSAHLIDLNDARLLWRRDYAAAPLARTRNAFYSGSSLGGSVATLLANTVLNGVPAPTHPPPPGLRRVLASLFEEVARDVPTR